eukprot:gene44069-59678_t
MDDLVQRRGMGLILISHNLHLVSSFCDRVLVMYAGQVVETAPLLWDRGCEAVAQEMRATEEVEEEDRPESAARGYYEPGCVLSGRRVEINQHFLEVFMAKNTSYRALLSPCGREVLFDGPVSNG